MSFMTRKIIKYEENEAPYTHRISCVVGKNYGKAIAASSFRVNKVNKIDLVPRYLIVITLSVSLALSGHNNNNNKNAIYIKTYILNRRPLAITTMSINAVGM